MRNIIIVALIVSILILTLALVEQPIEEQYKTDWRPMFDIETKKVNWAWLNASYNRNYTKEPK